MVDGLFCYKNTKYTFCAKVSNKSDFKNNGQKFHTIRLVDALFTLIKSLSVKW